MVSMACYIASHANITEIDLGLDLLWRSGVDPAKIVMGQGWYGRSFILNDPSCNKPVGVYEFSDGGKARPCSDAAGILDLEEINDIISKNSLKPVHDEKAAVKWLTWENDQLVSYDDTDTFAQKKDFASSRCLGGFSDQFCGAYPGNQKSFSGLSNGQVEQTKSNGLGPTPAETPPQQSNAKQMSDDQQASLTCKTYPRGVDCPQCANEVKQMNGQPRQLKTTDRCPKDKYQKLCCLDGT